MKSIVTPAGTVVPNDLLMRAERAERLWPQFATRVVLHDSIDAQNLLDYMSRHEPAPFIARDASDLHGLDRWSIQDYHRAFGTFPTRLMASRTGVFSYFNPKTVRLQNAATAVTDATTRADADSRESVEACEGIRWPMADPLLDFVPLTPSDNTSLCCAPHHAIGDTNEHDAWATLVGEATARPVLETGEAIYLRLHFAAQHPDRQVIQQLLSPRCLANQEAHQSRYSLYLSTKGTVTNLHFDLSDGLLHQLTGRKSVALWAPADARHLRMCGERCGAICRRRSFWDGELPPVTKLDRSTSDGASSDPTVSGMTNWSWPAPGVQTHHAVLEPGDTLFIPAGWPHYVTSLSATTASYVFALTV